MYVDFDFYQKTYGGEVILLTDGKRQQLARMCL